MTNAEHLIENAISFFEKSKDISYEEFKENQLIKEQAELIGVSILDIWYMAQYIHYTYRPSIRDEIEDEMIEKYGYRLED